MYNGFIVKNPSKDLIRRIHAIVTEEGFVSDSLSALINLKYLRVGPVLGFGNLCLSGKDTRYSGAPLVSPSKVTRARILHAFGVKQSSPRIPASIKMTVNHPNGATYKGVLTKV